MGERTEGAAPKDNQGLETEEDGFELVKDVFGSGLGDTQDIDLSEALAKDALEKKRREKIQKLREDILKNPEKFKKQYNDLLLTQHRGKMQEKRFKRLREAMELE